MAKEQFLFVIRHFGMKKVIYLLSVLIALNAGISYAQSSSAAYFLPEDSTGKVFISGIVEIPFSSDTIIGLAKDFEEEVAHWKNCDTGDKYFGLSKISFKTELGVGEREVDVPYVGTIKKPKSIVKFLFTLEVKDGKYRYTLSDFETERWRIRGDGPDDGPSNKMHRQRVACINGYPKKYKGFTREEYLAEEEDSLKAEYEAVMKFVKEVESMCNRFNDF